MTETPELVEFTCGCVFTADERVVSACRPHERSAFMFLAKNPVTRPEGMEPPQGGVGGLILPSYDVLATVDPDAPGPTLNE